MLRLHFKSHRNANRNGFTLLELIVTMTLITMMAGVVSLMWGTKVRVEMEGKTQATLDDLAQAYVAFYDVYGRAPSSGTELSSFMSKPGPPLDAWGREILIARQVTYDGAAYECVILSPGRNGIVDSTVSGTFIPSGDDLFRLVSTSSLDTTRRGITAYALRRLNTALTIYYANGGNAPECTTEGRSACVATLASGGYIDPVDGYDLWGRPFVLKNIGGVLQFISVGPDGQPGTADDVVVGRNTLS